MGPVVVVAVGGCDADCGKLEAKSKALIYRGEVFQLSAYLSGCIAPEFQWPQLDP